MYICYIYMYVTYICMLHIYIYFIYIYIYVTVYVVLYIWYKGIFRNIVYQQPRFIQLTVFFPALLIVYTKYQSYTFIYLHILFLNLTID